jgi:disease resistance protein RPM1
VRGEVKDDAVLQLLRDLQKLEILSLSMRNSTRSYVVDTDAWEAEGFLLAWRLRQLSLRWIRFSRFKSFCISPSRLPHLSQLSLHVDAMDEQDLRILGGLPQLRFLDLEVHSTAKVVCNNTRADDDACCLFQKLRRCSMWYREGVRLLLPSHEDSMRNVRTSMRLGSGKLDTICKAAGVARTPMPSFRELSFDAYVQEFIKDVGNHDDGCVSLALEYFASLRYVQALIDCDGETSAAEVEQLKAALLRAADAHPNRPTLKVIRTVKARRAHRDQSCSNSR